MSTIVSGSLPLRVLVVDADEREVAGTLAPFMRMPGAEFRLASDRLSALTIAAVFLPQVALFDLSLPRLEGFHLARQFRQSEQLRQVWLVAGSPFGDTAYRTLAKEAGFDDFVMKPYTPSRFQGLFDKVLDSQVPEHHAGQLCDRTDPAHFLAETAKSHGFNAQNSGQHS
jgi:DNA-binding response OmpR family regulator